MREDGRAARHRTETTTATVEDTARAIHRALAPRWMSVAQALGPGQDAYEAMLADIAQALADDGLLATARTRPTREQIAEHLRKRANDDEDHADRLYVLSADEWDRWYDEHLTVSHQIDGKPLRIEGRPETIADVVLALLRGGVE